MVGDEKSTTMDHLSQPTPGLPSYTCYLGITIAMIDNIRHLGKICLIKSLWQRYSEGIS